MTTSPPASRIEDLVETRHGVVVRDPYRWLEGDNSVPDRQGQVTPEVAAWTDAQNACTRAVLDGLPGRPALEARLRPLMEIGAVSLPDARGARYFYSRREGRQDQAVVYWREGADGDERVLIDPQQLDPTGLTTVEWVSASHDGRLAAYGTYRAGDENTTLRLLDVDRGAPLPLAIPNKVEAPGWLPDASGFVYRHLRDAADPYSGQVRFHRLGTDPSDDPVLFRQYTRDEDEALATTWGPFATLSRDGRWLVKGYWIDTRSNDLWVADFAAFLAGRPLDFRPVTIGEPGLAFGTVVDGRLFLRTTKGAPRGRIVALDPAEPDRGAWVDVVPEREDAVVEAVAFGRDCLAVTWLRDASSRVEVFDRHGRSRGELRQPGLGSVAIAAEPDRTEAFLQFTSFNHPTTIFRVDLADAGTPGAVWAEPDVPVDPSAVEVRQVRYASKDGTSISMFLVHRRGFTPGGDAPVWLTGYGGFNISLTPAFGATMFPWFEAGGVFAVPNLRGGGEYGDAWHEAGVLGRKQNVFDDFLAAADWLVSEGYTTRERLALSGGSNGGLLVGAAITQRPDVCRVAIIAVPLLDMLRFERFLMARYWVPEYGSAEQADAFAWLHAYSPYHHVVPGTRYPAVLLTAGEHDTRVHALHARKMAAALQAATTATPDERPVLLWVDREAGHGQGKPLSLRLRDVVDQHAFVRWQLGLDPGPRPDPQPGTEPNTP